MRIAALSTTVAASFLLAACSKKPAEQSTATADSSVQVNLLPEEQRSAGFTEVARHLDLGGPSYTYLDTDGLFHEMGEMLQSLGSMAAMSGDPQMGMANMLLSQSNLIVDASGLGGIKAYGESSYQDGTLYRNKSFVYIPDGRKGFFQLLGGEAAPFSGLDFAPADTDVFFESQLDVASLVKTIEDTMVALLGESGQAIVGNVLSQPVSPEDALTWGELLPKVKTDITVVVRLTDERQNLPDAPPGVEVPGVDAFIAFKDMAWLMTDLIEPQAPDEAVQEGDMRVLSLPLSEGEDSVLVSNTKTQHLYFSTSRSFFDSSVKGEGGLNSSSVFKAAIADLPSKGNTLFYASPRAFAELASLRKSMEQSLPMDAMQGFKSMDMFFPLFSIESIDQGVASVVANEPNGIFSDSRWPLSSGGLSGSPTATVATTGLLAAMAIPAFNKVREQSREKAIINNLRQVASAGQQYILEEGKPSVKYEQLEGIYFPRINPVAGESYDDLVVVEDGGTLSVTLANGETVEYRY